MFSNNVIHRPDTHRRSVVGVLANTTRRPQRQPEKSNRNKYKKRPRQWLKHKIRILFIILGQIGVFMAFWFLFRHMLRNRNGGYSPTENTGLLRSGGLTGIATENNFSRSSNALFGLGNGNSNNRSGFSGEIDMRELSFTLPFENVINNDGTSGWKQEWDVQPVSLEEMKEDPLKVFVVPHSHCDPGWIKTFNEYFQSQTKDILNTVVDALNEDPRRTFIWAEISFFEWWWREQSTERQDMTRRLLKSGQLEFVTGGWVQPDEASTDLYAMEIQLQEGHDWIRETFGEEYVPKYGWSIDPFGYSPTMAYLLKKYGFEAMLIQRVHYAVKKELALRKHLEFMWRQTWDETGHYDIFCHLMPFVSYSAPYSCGPDPNICCQFDFARRPLGTNSQCEWGTDPQSITDDNVKERSMLLLKQYRKKASLYRTNVILAPLGDDFRYNTKKEANLQYTNYQKIFDYLNSNVTGISIQFGTLSEYFKSVMTKFHPPILKGSFFTYSDQNEDYWSGYYTSRVFDKALGRKLERVLFAASSMGATKLELREPRRALSLFQHHDAITGTSKNHVVTDYAYRINNAINVTHDWMVRKIQETNTAGESVTRAKELQPCWKLSNLFITIGSDSLANSRMLRQDICDKSDAVFAYNPLDTVQFCADTIVPGRGLSLVKPPCEVPEAIPNSKAGIQFDPITGLMTHPFREEWLVWKGSKGGAYLFFPGELNNFDMNNVHIQDGGYVIGTSQWQRKVIEKKIPKEFEATTKATVIDFVYGINLQQPQQEWVVRFTATGSSKKNGNIITDSGGLFYTDLNGYNFDTHRRRRDMPIQSQIFPMPTLASLEDRNNKIRLTVLSEHAQGTASIHDDSIDVWLDRRLLYDDERGLEQGVMDNVPTRTRFRVVLEEITTEQAYYYYERDGGKENNNSNDHDKGEFRITSLCKRMWEELNHPLELFSAVEEEKKGLEQSGAHAKDGDFKILLEEEEEDFTLIL